MANAFYGTNSDDTFYSWTLSAGITTNPGGLTGTTDEQDIIFAYDGHDFVAGSGGDDYIYGGFGTDSLTGNEGNDTPNGGPDDDEIYADAGNDWLNGGPGEDFLLGGSGDDTYFVDTVDDAILEIGFIDGYDTVYSSATAYELSPDLEALILAGSGNQSGIGNSQANFITGNGWGNFLDGQESDDVLHGGAGNDTLHGGAGKDILIGGTGNDIFHFATASESPPSARDIIRAGDGALAFQGIGDRGLGGDRIDLSDIDANLGSTFVNEAFVFGGTGIGHLSLHDSRVGNTIVSSNTDRDAAFEIQIVIEDGDVSAAAYTAGDFIL